MRSVMPTKVLRVKQRPNGRFDIVERNPRNRTGRIVAGGREGFPTREVAADALRILQRGYRR